jgi:hypothetical protein
VNWCHTSSIAVSAVALSRHLNTVSARTVLLFAAFHSIALASVARGFTPQSMLSAVQLFCVYSVGCGVEGGPSADILDSRAPRRVFVSKRDGETGRCRGLHSEELDDLWSLPNSGVKNEMDGACSM